MTKQLTLRLSWILLHSTLVIAASPSWKVDLNRGKGKLEFKAIGHPSALRILGKGEAPHGLFTVAGHSVTGIATFELKSLDAGVKLRTRHLQEKYLQTHQYPEAQLKLTPLNLPQDVTREQFELNKVPFTGMLTLHGVTKPISGLTDLRRKQNQLSINAQFTLKISDYKIDIPSFMGITVADDVQVVVDVTAPITSGR